MAAGSGGTGGGKNSKGKSAKGRRKGYKIDKNGFVKMTGSYDLPWV